MTSRFVYSKLPVRASNLPGISLGKSGYFAGGWFLSSANAVVASSKEQAAPAKEVTIGTVRRILNTRFMRLLVICLHFSNLASFKPLQNRASHALFQFRSILKRNCFLGTALY